MCGVQVLASFCLNIMAPPLLTPQKEPPDIKWKVSVGYTGHTAVRLGVSHILIEMWWKWAFSFNHRFLFVLFLFFFSSSLPVYFCASIARPTPGRRKKNKSSTCTVCVCVRARAATHLLQNITGIRNSTSVGFLQGEETRAVSFFVFVLNRWLEKYCYSILNKLFKFDHVALVWSIHPPKKVCSLYLLLVSCCILLKKKVWNCK